MSPPASNLIRMSFRKTAVAAFAATLLSACGNDTLFNASLPTSADVYTVFALTGTPPSYPSALDTYFRQPVRVDGAGSFDVAFDLDSGGNVIVYPVKLVVRSLSGDRRVGLMKVAGDFASITSAPKATYQTDSAVVATKGVVIVVEAARNRSGDACQFALSLIFFTIGLTDSIALAPRTTVFHSAVITMTA